MISRHEPAEFDAGILFEKYDPEKRLDAYFAALSVENQKINLVSRETNDIGMARLAAESLVPLETVALQGIHTYLDIGSGGGFPAIPILLAKQARQERFEKTVLVERTQKRAGALRRIALSIGLRVEIVNMTLEDCDFGPEYDLVTLRLVKLTPALLTIAIQTLKPNGVLVYYSQPGFDVDETKFTASSYSFSLKGERHLKSFTVFKKK